MPKRDLFDWRDLAVKLVQTEELDPVYCMIARADLDLDTKKRFCVALYMFYDIGVAAELAQYKGDFFWETAVQIFPDARRASQRRHWRGQAGWDSLTSMRKLAPHPEHLIDRLCGKTYLEVRALVKKHLEGFGDYFIWKIADIQDRVFRVPCDFSGAEQFLGRVPREGFNLMRMADEELGFLKQTVSPLEYVNLIVQQTMALMAPPFYDRPINLQEYETIACAYRTHISGTYQIGDDLTHRHRELARLPDSEIVRALKKALPKRAQSGANLFEGEEE